jgi:uncharacterized protein
MPYLFVTRGVLDALSDSRVVSDTLDLTEVRLGEDVFTPLTPATFALTLSNTGAGIVASGTARATFRTRCVRCLCEYDTDVEADVDGFYVEVGDDVDLPEEQEREFITDERIDLEPAVVQSLVLSLPVAPLHSPDCAGICPSCGVDRNEVACACAPDAGGSPFAGLRDLFGVEEDV